MLTADTFQGALSPDVLSKIITVQAPDQMPIYAMLVGAGQVRITKSENPKWYASGTAARRTKINGGPYGAGTTALVVDNAGIFAPNDQLVAEATGEIMFVSAVDTGSNTITVKRSMGSVAAASGSVADNADLTNIGNAAGEGADSPESRAVGQTPFENWLQTFRKAVELSGRMTRIETLTEDERGHQRKRKFQELMYDIEHAIVHGAMSNNTTDANGKRVTTMGGLRESVLTNVTNIGGTMSKAAWNTFCVSVFSYGSNQKVLFGGPTLVQAITDLYDDKVRYVQANSKVGLNVLSVVTPFGELQVVNHRGLAGAFAGDGLAVDIGELSIRHSKDGLPTLKPDTEVKGKDGKRDEFFAELTLEFGSELNHAQIRGVTGADLT